MRLSKEALATKVVVRRARRGRATFVWEINHESRAEPLYVSPEAFVSMEAAYQAGRARLAEFTAPLSRSISAAADTHDWGAASHGGVSLRG